MRKAALVLTAVAGLLVFGLTGASGGAEQAPGVTSKVVKIGGTFPLSARGQLCTDRTRHERVLQLRERDEARRRQRTRLRRRQVKFIVYDDIFNPPQTVTQTIRLVDQDKVFATLGPWAPSRRGGSCVPQQERVPQLYVSTGATFWGAEQKDWKWTLGWQPDYQGEGAIYGRRIRSNTPNAKIAILYQNDDYGKDYIAGLEAGLGPRKSQIVATRGYNLTDASVAPQLLALRASGADTLMIFATPTHTIRTYATLRTIQWKPAQIYLNSVSATDTFMTIAVGLATPRT